MKYKKLIIPIEDVEFDILSKFKNIIRFKGNNVIVYTDISKELMEDRVERILDSQIEKTKRGIEKRKELEIIKLKKQLEKQEFQAMKLREKREEREKRKKEKENCIIEKIKKPRIQSPETRLKISESMKKRGSFSDEHKSKLRESHKGMTNKRHSTEAREKMSKSRKGKKLSEEHKLKIGKSMRERNEKKDMP